MHKKDCIFLSVLLAFFLVLHAQNAEAFDFKEGDISGFLDTTVSSGADFRVSQPSHALIGTYYGGTDHSVNNQQGDLNYTKGSVFSNASIITSDFGLSYQNTSAYISGSYFIDPVNLDKKQLTPYEQQNAGHGEELLDAYVEQKFEPAGKALDIRVGKQVINWGESTFIPGGLSVTNPIDATQLLLPGSEVRNALIPNYMVSSSYQLTDQVSLADYYLFHFERTTLPVCGTYFSTDNVFCDDGNSIGDVAYGQAPVGNLSSAVRESGREMPSNNNQFGASVHYVPPGLNDTDFGFYFLNYDNPLPVASAVGNPGGLPTYVLKYVGNLHVYGVSSSTNLWGVALQGEYTYRPEFPLQLDAIDVLQAAAGLSNTGYPAATYPGQILQGYREMPVNQLQGTVSKAFGRQNPFFADDWTITTEAAMIDVSHFPKNLHFDAPGVNLPSSNNFQAPGLQTSGWADAFSWGYVVETSCTYYQALKNTDLIPRVAFSQDVKGNTPDPLSEFVDRRMSLTLGITARYMQNLSIDLSYTNFFGAGAANLLSDRDFASVTVKYKF